MRSLVDGVRWMAVPIAAYLAITLVLPIANGAAGRAGFAEHAMWVVTGCAIVVGGGVVVAAVRRLVNNRTRERVAAPGGSR